MSAADSSLIRAYHVTAASMQHTQQLPHISSGHEHIHGQDNGFLPLLPLLVAVQMLTNRFDFQQ